jgi:hypothetical protein
MAAARGASRFGELPPSHKPQGISTLSTRRISSFSVVSDAIAHESDASSRSASSPHALGWDQIAGPQPAVFAAIHRRDLKVGSSSFHQKEPL